MKDVVTPVPETDWARDAKITASCGRNQPGGSPADSFPEAIADGNIAPIDTQIVAYAWVGSINELVMRWIQTGEPDPNRILPTLRIILMRSIGFDGDYKHGS